VCHVSGPDDRLIGTRFERMQDGSLRIEVHDTDETEPERREPSAEANSGRGLIQPAPAPGGPCARRPARTRPAPPDRGPVAARGPGTRRGATRRTDRARGR
jgi:hypothetical protein